MLKEKDLVKYDNYCYRSDSPISIEDVQNAIMSVAANNEIPMDVSLDEVSMGGLLNRSTNPCIVISHPAHKAAYLKFCVKLSDNGGSTFIDTYHFGRSKSEIMDNMMQNSRDKQAYKQAKANHEMRGFMNADVRLATKTYNAIGGAMSRGVMKLIKGSDKKQQEEEQWYSLALSVIDSVIS